jgi:hypothetical protein
LDMHCHELAERFHGAGVPVRAGMGSFSVTGLSPFHAPSAKQKRSFSLSSLRDIGFWEQRFEELAQLTGIEESESPKGRFEGTLQSPQQCLQHAGTSAQQQSLAMHLTAAGQLAHGNMDNTIAPADGCASATSGSLCPRQGVMPSPSSLVTSCSPTAGPKTLISSTSLSALHTGERGLGSASTGHGAKTSLSMLSRVASAPLIPSNSDVHAACTSSDVASSTHACQERQDLSSCAAQTQLESGDGGQRARQLTGTAPVPASAPAIGLTSTASAKRLVQAPLASPDIASSTSGSLHTSLSSVAMRQVGINLSGRDAARSQNITQAVGRSVGTGSSSRIDAQTDGGSLSTNSFASPPSLSPPTLGRTMAGNGTAAMHGGRAGTGAGMLGSSSPRNGATLSRPVVAVGSSSVATTSGGRFATARGVHSQRPRSLGLTRPRYVAATARGPVAYSPAVLQQQQQRHGT